VSGCGFKVHHPFWEISSCHLMNPVPAVTTVCGIGIGMAACPMLKVLVTASDDDLTVFTLPDSFAASGLLLTRIRSIEGVHSLNFKFADEYSGLMAFTGSTPATRLLLVTDAGNDAVHFIDVVHGAHVGYPTWLHPVPLLVQGAWRLGARKWL
jgi:hypothetical protein